MGLQSLFSEGKLKPWADVLDASQDGKSAPSLWEVALAQASEIYENPEEFFKRTFFTPSLKNVLEGVANRIKGKPKVRDPSGFFAYPNVVMLASRFGGGKTHTLITLYHAFSQPQSLRHVDQALATAISSLKDVEVISLDADSRKLVPHPLEPYVIENFRIATIWGMLAYRLGEYGKVKHLDSGEKPVPDPDTLKELLKGKKVLILTDEIVKYAFNMQRSKDTANYGDKVITFVENLAKAVEDTDSVLVIAVQADYKKGAESTASVSLMDFSPDYQYKDQAEKIIQALRRVSPVIITPVSYDDIGQVLKRRIFEEIPNDSASQAQSEFYAPYREHQGIFGVEGKWDFATATKLLTVKDTYPFHPKYIELLSDFVTRNKDLQRTRDAVNITRKVVRSLLRSDDDPLAIMPAHIDLRNREIRDNTITETYARDFDPIVNKDIVSRDSSLGNVKLCSNPQLARLIANSVILKTFTYETFKEALHVFPDLTDVALMVYEPDIFAKTDATPVDIQDLLNEMAGRLDHFIGDKGRFWFSPYRSVIEIIDKMAESIVREDKPKLYKSIEEIAQTIVNVSASKAREYEPLVFKDCKTVFVKPGYDVTQDISVGDDPRMKLVIFIKQPVSDDEIIDVILFQQGTPRLRKNTIVAVYPEPNKTLDDLLLFAARIVASAQVMDNLKEYYADQDVRGLQEKKLKHYRDQNGIYVRDGLLSTLTKIAFPSGDPTVKTVTAQKAPSLVEQVERSLNSAGAGYKIRERIDFSELAFYLKKNFGIDIVEGEKGVDFRYIFDDLFLAKPEGPFVARTQIEQAIRQGLRNFDIAIKQEGKLYWKKMNSPESDEPSSISDRAEILPFRLAARELVSTLRKEEGRKKTPEGHILETAYYVKILEDQKPLSTVASQVGFDRIIKENLVTKKETRIEEGFDLVLEHPYVTLKQLKHASITFAVDGIGGFADTVELQSDIGIVKPPKGKPPFNGTWELDAPGKPGTFRHLLTAKSGKMKRNYELNVLVESEFKVIETESLDLAVSGSQLIELRPSTISSFKIASDALDKLGFEGRARARVAIAGKVTCEIREMNPSLCSFLLQRFEEFKDRFGGLFQDQPEYSGTIEITKPLVLEHRAIANLQTLNKKAVFVIQVPR